jgi:hypothetical protein
MLPYLPVYSYYIGNNKKVFPGQDVVLNRESSTAGSISVEPSNTNLLSYNGGSNAAGSWCSSNSNTAGSISVGPSNTRLF